jgi:hypothetical protein
MKHSEEETGRMKAEIRYLNMAVESLRKELNKILRWQWKVIGFLTAITVLTELLFMYVELKGHP